MSALIEKCLAKSPNYFRLIVLAAYRAQEIASGSPALVPAKTHRSPIIALQEIAESLVDLKALEEKLVRSFQQCVFLSETSEDIEEE